MRAVRKTTTTTQPHLPPPRPTQSKIQPKKSQAAHAEPEHRPAAGNAPEAEAGGRFNYKAFWEKYKKHIIIALICLVILLLIIIIAIVIVKRRNNNKDEEGEFDDWEGFEDYQKFALKHHNFLRAKHVDTKPLKMNRDNKLNEVALNCASYYRARGDIDHSCPFRIRGDYGENLGRSFGWSRATKGNKTGEAKSIIDSWYYEEINLYDFDDPGYKRGAGHFTQIVWRSTTELGFAVVEDESSSYTVALYNPPGNLFAEAYKEIGRLKNKASSKTSAFSSCLLISSLVLFLMIGYNT